MDGAVLVGGLFLHHVVGALKAVVLLAAGSSLFVGEIRAVYSGIGKDVSDTAQVKWRSVG